MRFCQHTLSFSWDFSPASVSISPPLLCVLLGRAYLLGCLETLFLAFLFCSLSFAYIQEVEYYNYFGNHGIYSDQNCDGVFPLNFFMCSLYVWLGGWVNLFVRLFCFSVLCPISYFSFHTDLCSLSLTEVCVKIPESSASHSHKPLSHPLYPLLL